MAVLVLREVKRATDPILASVLSKVWLGICDEEVTEVLKSRVQPKDVSDIDLDRTLSAIKARLLFKRAANYEYN